MVCVVGSVGTRVGAVGAYVTAVDAGLARRVRDGAGHVTLTGRKCREVLGRLAREGDVHGVDIDVAGYTERKKPQLTLFDTDEWEVDWQRRLGVAVRRSPGCYVPAQDVTLLRAAFAEPVGAGVVRVVSLHHSWLRAGRRHHLPFAALGGRLGAVGLTTSTRHHSLPLPRPQKEAYEQRQSWPLVFVPRLLGWQRGTVLGALSAWDGAGLTGCDCVPCAGRSLLRFDGDGQGVPRPTWWRTRRDTTWRHGRRSVGSARSHCPSDRAAARGRCPEPHEHRRAASSTARRGRTSGRPGPGRGR